MTKELKTRKTIVRQNMKTAYTFTCKSNDTNKYTHVFSYLRVYTYTTMVLIYTNLLHHHAAGLHNILHIHGGSLEFCTIKVLVYLTL